MELNNIIKTVIREYLNEQQTVGHDNRVYYHGAINQEFAGKGGIHIGTKKAATQALQAMIGIPAEGEWDGTREYGKTLLAGKKTLKKKSKTLSYDPIIYFNAMDDVPEEDYYPKGRKTKAVFYSDGTKIPLKSKPLVFKVKITGEMMNTYDDPYKDAKANGFIERQLGMDNAKHGYYYVNNYEDKGSISAVVPDKSFIKII